MKLVRIALVITAVVFISDAALNDGALRRDLYQSVQPDMMMDRAKLAAYHFREWLSRMLPD